MTRLRIISALMRDNARLMLVMLCVTVETKREYRVLSKWRHAFLLTKEYQENVGWLGKKEIFLCVRHEDDTNEISTSHRRQICSRRFRLFCMEWYTQFTAAKVRFVDQRLTNRVIWLSDKENVVNITEGALLARQMVEYP